MFVRVCVSLCMGMWVGVWACCRSVDPSHILGAFLTVALLVRAREVRLAGAGWGVGGWGGEEWDRRQLSKLQNRSGYQNRRDSEEPCTHQEHSSTKKSEALHARPQARTPADTHTPSRTIVPARRLQS